MISAFKSLYEVLPIISIKCRPASYWYSLTSLQTRSFNEKTKVAPIVFFKFQQLGTLGYPEWKPTWENVFHLLHSCTVLPLYGKGACESNLSLVSFNYRFDRRLWRARWKVIYTVAAGQQHRLWHLFVLHTAACAGRATTKRSLLAAGWLSGPEAALRGKPCVGQNKSIRIQHQEPWN